MSTSMLSAVDALTGIKVPLATFSDENGNVVVGHVTLAGVPLSPVSQSNPIPVADGAIAAAVASLVTALAGIATAAGQTSLQIALNNILTKLNSVNIAGTVTVQDAAAENSLVALTAIRDNTLGLATAAGQASSLAQETAISTVVGSLSDVSWDGSGDGSLVSISKAVVAAVEAVVSKLEAKLTVQQTDPLPAGTNAIGTVLVSGVVSVQDSAAEAALSSTLKVAHQGPLPSGANQIGTVGVTGTVSVQDAVGEASLANIAVSTSGVAAAIGTSTDSAWTGMGGSTLVGLLRALYARLNATIVASLTGPLPAGTNTIGAVSVSGVVAVQDSAMAAALNGSIKVEQQGPLPAGTNQIGTVGVTGTVSVQDAACEAALTTISANANVISGATGTATDSAWAGSGGGTLISVLKAVYARLSGTLAASIVSPLPAGTNSIGSVSVLNLPSTQMVSGTISVSNWQAMQVVSGTVEIAGTVAVQDSAAAASLSNVAAALGGILSVQQAAQLPAGTNMLGGMQARNGVTLSQTVVNLSANADTQLLGPNNNRKSCGFFLLTPGITGYLNLGSAALLSNGLPFGQGSQFGYGYTWEGSGVPVNAIHMIAPSNATVIVWEGM